MSKCVPPILHPEETCLLFRDLLQITCSFSLLFLVQHHCCDVCDQRLDCPSSESPILAFRDSMVGKEAVVRAGNPLMLHEVCSTFDTRLCWWVKVRNPSSGHYEKDVIKKFSKSSCPFSASTSDTNKRNTRYAIARSINAVGQLLSNNLLFARGSVYLRRLW
jgi:hypothetical protein